MADLLVLEDGTEIDRAAFPLPDEIEDRLVSLADLADIMDVREPTIGNFIKRGMPVRNRGAQGRSYELSVRDCLIWRMWWQSEEERHERDRRAANMRDAALFRNLEDDDEGLGPGAMSAKEVLENSQAILAYAKAREVQGSLVPVDRVRHVIEDLLRYVSRSLLTLPDFAERELGLTIDQIEKLDRRARTDLLDLKATLSAWAEDASEGGLDP